VYLKEPTGSEVKNKVLEDTRTDRDQVAEEEMIGVIGVYINFNCNR
jgi:hypothetical protein